MRDSNADESSRLKNPIESLLKSISITTFSSLIFKGFCVISEKFTSYNAYISCNEKETIQKWRTMKEKNIILLSNIEIHLLLNKCNYSQKNTLIIHPEWQSVELRGPFKINPKIFIGK